MTAEEARAYMDAKCAEFIKSQRMTILVAKAAGMDVETVTQLLGIGFCGGYAAGAAAISEIYAASEETWQ